MKHHRQLWKTTKEHGKRRQNSGKPLLIASLLVGLLALPLGTAQATTITVDGNCTLPNAIIAANTNTISGGCPAGEGNETDTIVLNEDVTLTFIDDTVDIANYGPNGLPVVTSDIIIEGNGHIIQRGTSPLCPGYDLLSDFRIFVVTSDADLTLQDTTVRYGCSAFGGGINNGGALTLIDTTITDSTVVF